MNNSLKLSSSVKLSLIFCILNESGDEKHVKVSKKAVSCYGRICKIIAVRTVDFRLQ